MIWITVLSIYIFILSPAFAILAYIALSHVKRVRDEGLMDLLPWWVLAVCYASFGLGWPSDVLLNYTYGVYRFEEVRGVTLTSRLKFYRELPATSWRKQQAIKGWSWLNLFDKGHW